MWYSVDTHSVDGGGSFDMTRSRSPKSAVAILVLLASASLAWAQTFTTFETGQVRPLALSPDGTQLLAVNTPDNRVELFDVGAGGLTHTGSVPVGMEPAAVAFRSNTEAWVVNHLSDSVSIVDLASVPPRVSRTLLVGDEPRDIVFAGPGGNRAFITTAHRGQNSPIDPQLTTEGVGRADVWVFDATDLGTALGGQPETIITLFGDTPRALAVSPDGNTVFAAVFHSGNQTTALSEGVVCNGGVAAQPCTVFGTQYPGGLPAPNQNHAGESQPETGLIVRFNQTSGAWEDELGRNWNNGVRFSLPDRDVFEIDATTNPPTSTGGAFVGVGTILFNMIVNPANDKVYVTNTEARNEVRFEGPGTISTTVRGHLHEARISVLEGPTSVTPRHLNKHINYAVVPSPPGVEDDSLATPLGMAINAAGTTVYVAAFGSSKVGVFDTAALENDTFTPDSSDHIAVSGGGPSGLVLDEANGRLYVFTRFDNAVSVVNTTTNLEEAHLSLHNPEPDVVVDGRPVLYDALLTSSNGEASCAACHIFGDFDSLAWDLGNPDDDTLNNPNPIRFNIGQDPDFAPMKGPMTTQSLRGMANHGPMHWRGDRTGGNDIGGDALAEDQAFKKFNPAFEGLIGNATPIADADMDRFTDFILEVHYPPNPIAPLDNQLVGDALAGRTLFFGAVTDQVFNCDGCHDLDEAAGFFGTDGFTSFENEPQMLKIPHMRNMYQKVGMFGMPAVGFIGGGGDDSFQGPQVRGFGFLHDGSIDTVFRFLSAGVFSLNDTQQRQLEAFSLQFPAELAPIVGQQVTLTQTNAATVGPRITLMIQRAIAGECEVITKGNVGSDARGAYRLVSGFFQTDRASEPLLTDAQVRALATVAGQEITYTCVPPGSGERAGVDRDEDGFFDQDEIDAGSDPADPNSTPGGPTFVLIPTKTLKLKDDSSAPIALIKRRILFKSNTRKEGAQNKIVVPAPGGPGDPTANGATLTVYNSGGLTSDQVVVALPAANWSLIGSVSKPRGWRFKDANPDGPIRSVLLKNDRLKVNGGRANWTYTLNEPMQGSVAVRLESGTSAWCADGPAKATGNPPSTAKHDRVDRFRAEPKSPAPVSCPPLVSSPSGAFLLP